MSRIRTLLIGAAIIAGVLASTTSAQAQCVPNPIPPNWLQLQENAGGHTIALHVGQTDHQLTQRLINNPHIPAAGSYPAALPPAVYSTAQATITAGLAANTVAINNWANVAVNGARQAYNYAAPGVIGRVATRNPPHAPQVANTNNFRVVFQALGGGNCFILTSYPRP
jgi:hypothetical protein